LFNQPADYELTIKRYVATDIQVQVKSENSFEYSAPGANGAAESDAKN